MLLPGPKGARISFSAKDGGKNINLPCGRCIGCRLERSRQWAVRIMHEAKMHSQNSFLTLTYDNANIPKNGSLSVEHCQLFLKRLRKALLPTKIRFFLCGEYGEKLGRPHYHAIIFGYNFPDKVGYENKSGHALSESAQLNQIWGLGACRVGNVDFDSAAYVANYATKKITGPSAADHYQGRKPEFLLMSRRPGLARTWYEAYGSDVYPSDEVIVRGKQTKPPRYYDTLFAASDPEAFEMIKDKRNLKADHKEDMTLKGGHVVSVAPGRNGRRLAVRETCAAAQLAQKNRHTEI